MSLRVVRSTSLGEHAASRPAHRSRRSAPPRELVASIVRASASSAPASVGAQDTPAGTRAAGSGGTGRDARSSQACELGVGGRRGVERVLDQELELLPEPAPDDGVVAVQTERQGLARRELLAHVARRRGPSAPPRSAGAATSARSLATSESIWPGVMTMRLTPSPRPSRHRKTTKSSAPIARKWTSGSRHQRRRAFRQALMTGRARSPRQGPVRG